MEKKLLNNYHTHTTRCRHASGTEREFVEHAVSLGMTTLGFSDHTPYIFPGGYLSYFRMRENEAEDYFNTVRGWKEEYKDKINKLVIYRWNRKYPFDMAFDLDPEKEKEAKKYANATTKKKPTNYQFKQRERKSNPTKAGIISELAKFLQEQSENACEEVTILNAERQIGFAIGEQKYELTLVAKRAPKK